jgi:hypothetical protein
LRLFQGVNWEASLRTENDCLIYDSRQLVTMLKDAQAALQRVGSLPAAGANQQYEETDFILKSAVRKNNIRQISFARDSSLSVWAVLLEVVSTNRFTPKLALLALTIQHLVLSRLSPPNQQSLAKSHRRTTQRARRGARTRARTCGVREWKRKRRHHPCCSPQKYTVPTTICSMLTQMAQVIACIPFSDG